MFLKLLPGGFLDLSSSYPFISGFEEKIKKEKKILEITFYTFPKLKSWGCLQHVRILNYVHPKPLKTTSQELENLWILKSLFTITRFGYTEKTC